MENLASLTDLDLLGKIASYDSAAFEEMYNRYSPVLFSLAKKILKQDVLAEEVLEDVFETIWRKAGVLDLQALPFYTWIIILTRNKAVDLFKRAGKEAEGSFMVYDNEFESAFIMPEISGNSTSLNSIEEAAAYKSAIESSLSSLTDAQKYVLHLAFYEGNTEKEIAGKLRIPYQTVKGKIKVATVNLKNNLQG